MPKSHAAHIRVVAILPFRILRRCESLLSDPHHPIWPSEIYPPPPPPHGHISPQYRSPRDEPSTAVGRGYWTLNSGDYLLPVNILNLMSRRLPHLNGHQERPQEHKIFSVVAPRRRSWSLSPVLTRRPALSVNSDMTCQQEVYSANQSDEPNSMLLQQPYHVTTARWPYMNR